MPFPQWPLYYQYLGDALRRHVPVLDHSLSLRHSLAELGSGLTTVDMSMTEGCGGSEVISTPCPWGYEAAHGPAGFPGL